MLATVGFLLVCILLSLLAGCAGGDSDGQEQAGSTGNSTKDPPAQARSTRNPANDLQEHTKSTGNPTSSSQGHTKNTSKPTNDPLVQVRSTNNLASEIKGKIVFVSANCAKESKQRTVMSSSSASASPYGASNKLCVVNADGAGVTRTIDTAGYVDLPAWSPDGEKIAFLLGEDQANENIWLLDAKDSKATRLTDTASDRQRLAWSPDGEKIAFTGVNPDVGPYIFVMKSDGSGETKLLNRAGAMDPAWSPDGEKIVFSFRNMKKLMRATTDVNRVVNCDLYAMRSDGTGEPMRLTDERGCDTSPDWSPNGKKIVFVRDNHIYVMNADGTGIAGLTNTLKFDTLYTYEREVSPAWSPDGKRIAFIADHFPFADICTIAPDGSNPTLVRTFVRRPGSLDW
jgi:Tol biopolymer transport system component